MIERLSDSGDGAESGGKPDGSRCVEKAATDTDNKPACLPRCQDSDHGAASEPAGEKPATVPESVPTEARLEASIMNVRGDITQAEVEEKLRVWMLRIADHLCTCPCCSSIWEVLGAKPPANLSAEELTRARDEIEP